MVIRVMSEIVIHFHAPNYIHGLCIKICIDMVYSLMSFVCPKFICVSSSLVTDELATKVLGVFTLAQHGE